MRPTLGDRLSCLRGFPHRLRRSEHPGDVPIGGGASPPSVFRLSQLSPESKASLRCVYASLAKELPDDPASPKYLELLAAP